MLIPIMLSPYQRRRLLVYLGRLERELAKKEAKIRKEVPSEERNQYHKRILNEYQEIVSIMNAVEEEVLID